MRRAEGSTWSGSDYITLVSQEQKRFKSQRLSIRRIAREVPRVVRVCADSLVSLSTVEFQSRLSGSATLFILLTGAPGAPGALMGTRPHHPGPGSDSGGGRHTLAGQVDWAHCCFLADWPAQESACAVCAGASDGCDG